MPERDKQVDMMARTIAGAGPRRWNTRLGERPANMSEDAWQAGRATADRVYVDMMETFDFQRILIEANKRHLAVHPNKTTLLAAADIGVMTVEAICHDCIREVMLATDTNPPWTEEASSPRYLLYVVPELGPAIDPDVDPSEEVSDWNDGSWSDGR